MNPGAPPGSWVNSGRELASDMVIRSANVLLVHQVRASGVVLRCHLVLKHDGISPAELTGGRRSGGVADRNACGGMQNSDGLANTVPTDDRVVESVPKTGRSLTQHPSLDIERCILKQVGPSANNVAQRFRLDLQFAKTVLQIRLRIVGKARRLASPRGVTIRTLSTRNFSEPPLVCSCAIIPATSVSSSRHDSTRLDICGGRTN